MKKLIELLNQAELEAKRLADAPNATSQLQILRARVRSALDFAESPACSPAAAPSTLDHRPSTN